MTHLVQSWRHGSHVKVTAAVNGLNEENEIPADNAAPQRRDDVRDDYLHSLCGGRFAKFDS